MMTGATFVRADRVAIWRALHDTHSLQPCVAGCTSLQRVSATTFALAVPVGIGPVRTSVAGTVEIAACEAPREMTLEGRSQRSPFGEAAGTLRITLTELPGGCRMGYAIEAETRGPLAVIGPSLTSGIAQTLTDSFLAAFKAQLEAPRRTPPATRRLGTPTAAFS